MPGLPDPSYLPGVKSSSVWTAPPVNPSNVTTGKITFKSDIPGIPSYNGPLFSLPPLPTPKKIFFKNFILKTSTYFTWYSCHLNLTTLFILVNQKPCFRWKHFNRYLKVRKQKLQFWPSWAQSTTLKMDFHDLLWMLQFGPWLIICAISGHPSPLILYP